MTRHSILVVDDSPTDRHFLSELLLSQGYHVTAVDNGEAALAAIKSNPPHLVIMDVVMPGQNGFQATREITRDPATRSLPVIICTSKNQETDRIWGIRQGARDFMVKPVDQALLLQKIATILSNVSAFQVLKIDFGNWYVKWLWRWDAMCDLSWTVASLK